jgi:hypothetical protein
MKTSTDEGKKVSPEIEVEEIPEIAITVVDPDPEVEEEVEEETEASSSPNDGTVVVVEELSTVIMADAAICADRLAVAAAQCKHSAENLSGFRSDKTRTDQVNELLDSALASLSAATDLIEWCNAHGAEWAGG